MKTHTITPLLKLSACPLEKGGRSSLLLPGRDGSRREMLSLRRGPVGTCQGWREPVCILGTALPNAAKLTRFSPRFFPPSSAPHSYKSESLYLGSSQWKMKSRANLAVNEIRRKIRTHASCAHARAPRPRDVA